MSGRLGQQEDWLRVAASALRQWCRRESELLAASQDPEQTYVQELLPEKIRSNRSYAAKATLWSDFRVILRTLGLWPAAGR